MADDDVLSHIQQLTEEEHALYERHRAGKLSEDEHRRLDDLQVRLDQYWDLLRQRRARREFGEDPSAAEERDESTVEGYRQ